MEPNIVEIVPLRYDVAFKKAFGQVEVFNAFVRDVLGIEFEVGEVIQEFSYHDPVGRVKLKYDLFAEDTERRIIVEIQHAYESDFFDRFLYYHLVGMIEQVHNFRDYRIGKTVYTIVVLTSLPKDTEHLFATMDVGFECRDERSKSHALYPHRMIFLNPHLLNDHVAPGIRLWLQAVQDSLDTKVDLAAYHEYPLLQRAFLSVQKQAFTPEEFTKLKDEAAWERAQQESREDGRSEGLQQGLQQGRDEGREEQRKEIARKMLSLGLATEQITSATDFTEEELAALQTS